MLYSRFFNDSIAIYPLQFGLGLKYSATHALISLTEDIIKDDEVNLYEVNIGYGIFVDL